MQGKDRPWLQATHLAISDFAQGLVFSYPVESHAQDMDSTLACLTAYLAFLPLPGPPIRSGATPFLQSDPFASQRQTLQEAATVWQPIFQERRGVFYDRRSMQPKMKGAPTVATC